MGILADCGSTKCLEPKGQGMVEMAFMSQFRLFSHLIGWLRDVCAGITANRQSIAAGVKPTARLLLR